MDLSQGAYTIQGLNVLDIADQFGTPLYIYDGDKIAHQVKTLKNAFSDTDVKVKYAAKALTTFHSQADSKTWGRISCVLEEARLQ